MDTIEKRLELLNRLDFGVCYINQAGTQIVTFAEPVSDDMRYIFPECKVRLDAVFEHRRDYICRYHFHVVCEFHPDGILLGTYVNVHNAHDRCIRGYRVELSDEEINVLANKYTDFVLKASDLAVRDWNADRIRGGKE